nr:M1 family aminopeptidase [Anaeromonas frigoriresistens]
MRDFAWVGSEFFEKVVETHDGIDINLYFLKGIDEKVKEKTIEYAINSMNHFNNTFGKYPYGQYSIVETGFPSGMEYPGIVFIGERYYDISVLHHLEHVLVHETAHQWWYGVVGNDEIDEAWLDESLATYSEVVYTSEQYGESRGEYYYDTNIKQKYERDKDTIKDGRIVKSLSKFGGWDDYSALAYWKGAMMLYEIEKEYGREKLYEILHHYYKENKFKNATTEDFISIAEEVTGEELDSFMDEWLYSK